MEIAIITGVLIQILALTILAIRVGRNCLGKVGFLMAAYTFIYHGLTEITQAIFPDRNFYRDMITRESLAQFVLTISLAMALFVAAYLLGLRKTGAVPPRFRLFESLEKTLFLRWPVLIGISMPAYLLVALRHDRQDAGYWGSGLTDQFVPYLLALAFATVCVKTEGRRFLIVAASFTLLLSAFDSRATILSIIVVGLSAMVRYRIHLPRKKVLAGLAVMIVSFVAMSTNRSVHGRFADEAFSDRLRTLASSLEGGNVSTETLLDDFVYRYDGNSFGALLQDKQSQGYGVTGFSQIAATVSYMIPSFINTSKLNLDESLRNEESYDVEFYSLTEGIDYLSDFWTILFGYGGHYPLWFAAFCLGFAVARLDSWLAKSTSAVSYVIGIWASIIPVSLESGPSVVLYTMRAFSVVLFFVLLANRRPGLAKTTYSRLEASASKPA